MSLSPFEFFARRERGERLTSQVRNKILRYYVQKESSNALTETDKLLHLENVYRLNKEILFSNLLFPKCDQATYVLKNLLSNKQADNYFTLINETTNCIDILILHYLVNDNILKLLNFCNDEYFLICFMNYLGEIKNNQLELMLEIFNIILEKKLYEKNSTYLLLFLHYDKTFWDKIRPYFNMSEIGVLIDWALEHTDENVSGIYQLLEKDKLSEQEVVKIKDYILMFTILYFDKADGARHCTHTEVLDHCQLLVRCVKAIEPYHTENSMLTCAYKVVADFLYSFDTACYNLKLYERNKYSQAKDLTALLNKCILHGDIQGIYSSREKMLRLYSINKNREQIPLAKYLTGQFVHLDLAESLVNNNFIDSLCGMNRLFP